MSLGDGTTCVATQGGAVKCWGRNDHGQLGQLGPGAIGDDETPDAVPFLALEIPALEILTTGDQTFALLRDGSLRAWGASASPTPEIGESVTRLAVGEHFACARLMEGAVRCWDTPDDPHLLTKLQDVDLGGLALDVTAGAHHACALLDGGTVRCWGANDLGQLGQGHTDDIGDDEGPVRTASVELGGRAVKLVAGGLHTCALLAAGTVRCWGDDQQGQLGYGRAVATPDHEIPAALGDVPVGGTVVDLAAGWQHTCAVLETGALRCWGDGLFGQLGYGSIDDIGDDETPAVVGDVDLAGLHAMAVFSGPLSRSTCVQLHDGATRCWGDNDFGQLGQGHTRLLGDEPAETPGDLPNIIILDDDD